MKRLVSLFLTACGASTPQPTHAVVHVEPVTIAVDAGPKCVEPIDEPPPKWSGTYPKTMPRFTSAAMGDKQKELLARNPDLEALLFDERGFVYGFMTARLPYQEAQMTTTFLTGRNVLADAQKLLAELRCRNPDVAHFDATKAWLGRSTQHSSLIVERAQLAGDRGDVEPLPPPLDDDTLLSKWNVGVEVARVHQIVVHHPAQRCTPTPNQPCDPIGPRDETIDKRVVVGTVPVAKKYLKVNVTRASYPRATTYELRLVARVEVRWPELQSEVITPRFGSTLEPQLTGNFRDVFDAVTGDPFNPYAP